MDVSHPLQLVESVFNSKCGGGSSYDPTWVDGVPLALLECLQGREHILSSIPVLTGASVRSGSHRVNTLVRYTGLVQDTFDPEWYTALSEIRDDSQGGAAVEGGFKSKVVPLAFTDSAPPPLPGTSVAVRYDVMERRLPIYLVPLPGESRWARDMHRGDTSLPAAVGGDAGVFGRTQGEGGAQTGKKRGLEKDTEGGGGTSSSESHAMDDDSVRGTTSTKPIQGPAWCPLVLEAELPALVKVYGSMGDLGASLRVGMAVEVIGILSEEFPLECDEPASSSSSSSSSSASAPDNMMEGEEDWVSRELLKSRAARNPPPSVPRIHAILMRPLAPTFPVLQPPGTVEGVAGAKHGPYFLRDPNTPPPVPPGSGDWVTPASAAREALSEYALASPLSATLINTATAGGSGSGSGSGSSEAPPTWGLIKSQVLSFLAGALGGDTLAAEWALLSIISHVTIRRGEGESPIGKLSLTLTHFPNATTVGGEQSVGTPPPAPPTTATATTAAATTTPTPIPTPAPILPLHTGASPAVRKFHAALALLLPRTVLLPLRMENLNALQFYPRKCVDNDRLSPGVLQLAPGTPVIVDESVLQEGKLGEVGVKNLSALQSVAGTATLPYDFFTHTAHWECDHPILVCTSSTKSLLRTDVTLPLSKDASKALQGGSGAVEGGVGGGKASSSSSSSSSLASSSSPPTPSLSPEFLAKARAYLALVRSSPYKIEGDMAKIIETSLSGGEAASAMNSMGGGVSPRGGGIEGSGGGEVGGGGAMENGLGGGGGGTTPRGSVRGKLTAQEMHLLLDTARLSAMSCGETVLTVERWRATLALNVARVGRYTR